MKKDRGRPTIKRNYLLGIYTDWKILLESAWPEIGWQLLMVKQNVSATSEDVRNAMSPLARAEINRSLATHFFERNPLPATAHEVRQYRKQVGKLLDRVQEGEKKADGQFEHCLEAGRLLEEVGSSDGSEIEAETTRRYTDHVHNCHELLSLRGELDACVRDLRKREAYVSQSQLLDYLHSKRGRVHPRKLAKALAGLPAMNWRQSSARCRKFSAQNSLHINYTIVNILRALSSTLGGSIASSSLSALESAFRKLGNQRQTSMRFVREHWRDLRLAAEQLSTSEQFSDGQLPYVLATSLIARIKLPKSRSESFLAKSEALKLS